MSEEMKQPFTFNGVELPDFVVVTGIEYPMMPDITPITRTIPRMYGDYLVGNDIKGGEFKFDIKVILTTEMNILDAMDEIKKFLMGDNFKESRLVFREQPDKYYRASLTGSTSLKDLFAYGEGSFTLYASKLLRYKFVSFKGKDNEVLVKNNGDIEAYPVFVIQRAKTDYIEIVSDYGNIILHGEESEFRNVRIDTENMEILSSLKKSNHLLDLDSKWFTIPKGDCEIKLVNKDGEPIEVGAFRGTMDEKYI